MIQNQEIKSNNVNLLWRNRFSHTPKHIIHKTDLKNLNVRRGVYCDSSNILSVIKYLFYKHKLNKNDLNYFKKYNKPNTKTAVALTYFYKTAKANTSKSNYTALKRIETHSKQFNIDGYKVRLLKHYSILALQNQDKPKVFNTDSEFMNNILIGDLMNWLNNPYTYRDTLKELQNRVYTKAINEIKENIKDKLLVNNLIVDNL